MTEEWTPSSFHGPGTRADLCAATLWGKERWRSHQCSRKRGHGPEQAYCKQHSPEAKQAREDAQRAKWQAEMARTRNDRAIRAAKDEALNACRAIAAGHNDPRGLAQKVVNMAEGSE